MKIKKFIITTSVILSSVLLGVLFIGSSVSAASIYDDIVETTPDLVLQGTGSSAGQQIDISQDWFIQYREAIDVRCNLTGGNYCTTKDRFTYFDENLLDLEWAVFKVTNGGVESIEIAYWEKGEVDVVFGTSRGVPSLEFNGNVFVMRGLVYNAHQWSNSSGLSINVSPSSVVSSNRYYLHNKGFYSNTSAELNEIFFITQEIEYPTGYEGEIIPDRVAPPGATETLYPDYEWSIKKDENDNGILTIKYIESMPHFLTGTSFLVVDKMEENWTALDEEVASLNYQPAGWAEWSVNLGQGQGWYMFRIDHNQQLDSPPWGENDNYIIGQVYYQIFWDGQKAYISGTTIGCDGVVCNEFFTEDEETNPFYRTLSAIKISELGLDTGLTLAITAPIDFISSLPARECTPVDLPLPFMSNKNITLPCLKPIYDEYASPLVLVYQLTLTGLVSYATVTKVFDKLRQTYNPRQDRIEVTNL